MSAGILERVGLLREFDAEDRAALASLLETRRVAPGEVLFFEGDESQGLLLVANGALKLESRRAGALGQLEAGGALGGASLVSLGAREATATAVEPTALLSLDRSAFRRLVQDAPRTACRLLEAIATDLADALRPALDRVADGVDRAATDP